jgi:hypothetical protein
MSYPKTLKWLDAIEKVLEESDRPLHSNEIARIAIDKGWAASDAMAPDHTVQAAVYRHIKDGANQRGFVMVGDGRVDRCYWLKSKGDLNP